MPKPAKNQRSRPAQPAQQKAHVRAASQCVPDVAAQRAHIGAAPAAHAQQKRPVRKRFKQADLVNLRRTLRNLHLLARARRACAVCPGKTLRLLAKRRGWQILNWNA